MGRYDSSDASLLETLGRLALAKRSKEDDAIDRALTELGLQLRHLFQRRIDKDLDGLNDGYLRTVEETEDVLSEVLFTVYRNAEAFRGQTEMEARCWLQTTVKRKMLDIWKKHARRSAKWRDFFRAIPKRLRVYLETTSSGE